VHTYAEVILPLALPRKFTYVIPPVFEGFVKPGMRVLVQFGKTRYYAAIVCGIKHDFKGEYIPKPIDDLLDQEPILDEVHLTFWEWMASYYLCTAGEVMSAAMPSGLRLSSETIFVLHPDFSETPPDLNERDYMVCEALRKGKTLSTRDVETLTGNKHAMPLMRRLIEKKIAISAEDLKHTYKPKMRTWILPGKTLQTEDAMQKTLAVLEKAPRQFEVMLRWLQASKWVSPDSYLPIPKETLAEGDSGAQAAVRELLKKGFLMAEDREEFRVMLERESDAQITLSDVQTKAFDAINAGFAEKKPVLLHGITGSGKTEIYLSLINQTLARGKQVLFLVPEIALTTQLVIRLRKYFGDQLGIYHSKFGENERTEVWQRVFWKGSGRLNVVAGARSALFLPFADLGLIVVDEAHDTSYKQSEPAPRFHGRDTALQLAHLAGANILLGSATPSFESLFNCDKNKFVKVDLTERYGQALEPQMHLCDISRARFTKAMKASLTPELFAACGAALEDGEQIILFQNRRGFAPMLQCAHCGHVKECPRCDISLTWHKSSQMLNCHYCGHSEAIPAQCPKCNHPKLILMGKGTERIEEDVELLFPHARIARLDLDSSRASKAYEQVIGDFASGKTDFLIGTQMVTKGLDFDRVGVVGIIDADRMLRFPDFRAYERAFQMITQVAGRAGRRQKQGRVFIQSAEQENAVLNAIMAGDYLSFYRAQMEHRKQFGYPPYSRLVRIELRHLEEAHVAEMAEVLGKWLQGYFGARLLGPEKPSISRIRNRYIRHLLIKLNKGDLRAEKTQIIHAIRHLEAQAKDRNLRIITDVDPV
jgi:primosomal protein N' (replication factor Y)